MEIIDAHKGNEQVIACTKSKLRRINEAIPVFLEDIDAIERGVLVNIEDSIASIALDYEKAVRRRQSFINELKQAGYGILFD